MDLNLAQIHEAIADAIPERECIVFRDRRYTWAETRDRTRRLANVLGAAGLGARREGRTGLAGHESHQDHLAIYAYNGNEYLEGMIGAFKARVAPVNVNYRYVAEELRYLLADCGAKAVLFHSAFAPTLAEVLTDLPAVELLLQIADDSGNDLLACAQWYEQALADAPATLPACASSWSPDDLYILYTGGTTGMPKGVLWRHHDIVMSVMGGRAPDGTPYASADAMAVAAAANGMKTMPAAPFMHGAGHWIAFLALNTGGTVFVQSVVDHLDGDDVLGIVEREGVVFLQLVGDAFARPILEVLGTGRYDASSLFIVLSGGAARSVGVKERFLELLPNVMIIDGLGSSEGGGQMQQITTKGGPVSTGEFNSVGPGCALVGARRPGPVEPSRRHRGAGPRRGDHQLRGREDLRRGGRGRPPAPSGGVRHGGVRPSQRTVGQRGGGGGAVRARRLGHAGRTLGHRGRPHRPLQVAQGLRDRRQGRALPRRQGRLPLGQGARRRLNTATFSRPAAQ